MAPALSQRSLRREEKNVCRFIWGNIKEIIVLKKEEIGISPAVWVAWEHFKLPWLISFNWKSPTCLVIPHLGIWLPCPHTARSRVCLDTQVSPVGVLGHCGRLGSKFFSTANIWKEAEQDNHFSPSVVSKKEEWPGNEVLHHYFNGPRGCSKGFFQPQMWHLTALHTVPHSGSLRWDVKWPCQQTMHVTVVHRAVLMHTCVPVPL